MRGLLQDIRFGLRMMLKYRVITSLAILALAVGIGVNTTIFSLINMILYHPYPFKDLDTTVVFVTRDNALNMFGLPPDVYEDWHAQQQSYEHLGAMQVWDVNLTGVEAPERLEGMRFSSEVFSILGASPIHGRLFLEEEETQGRNNVVLLGYGFWQRQYAGNPGIVGQTISLNGNTHTVIGIMAEDFQFPFRSDLWSPVTFSNIPRENWTSSAVIPVARLKAGVTIAQAQSEMDLINDRLQQIYPDVFNDSVPFLKTLREMFVVEEERPIFAALLGAVGFILLIACANVISMLLSRAADRQREVAIRISLGARRFVLVRQFLVESLLLSLCGGVLGILIALWSNDLITSALSARDLPIVLNIHIDETVLAYTMIISLASGLLTGMIPAMRGTLPVLNLTLKETGSALSQSKSRQRISRGLVIGQVALSCVLAVGAGLLINSVMHLTEYDSGFPDDRVLTFRVGMPRDIEETQYDRKVNFFGTLEDRLKGIPGVESVGITNMLPHTGVITIQTPFQTDEAPDEPVSSSPRGTVWRTTSGHFEAFDMSLLQGRLFTDLDRQGSEPVLIINETLARRTWPDMNPLNKRIRITLTEAEPTWYTVIGIVQDVPDPIRSRPPMDLYLSHWQAMRDNAFFTVRFSTEMETILPAVRNAVREVAPDQPMFDIRTMEQVYNNETVSGIRLISSLFGILGGIGIVLSIAGIYGVISYSISQRTHEIGVRLAVGAQKRDILNLVVGQGMGMVGIGLVFGLLGAIGTSQLISNIIFGISPTDPITYVTILLAFMGVAFLACYLPSRRAIRVNPVVALRHE